MVKMVKGLHYTVPVKIKTKFWICWVPFSLPSSTFNIHFYEIPKWSWNELHVVNFVHLNIRNLEFKTILFLEKSKISFPFSQEQCRPLKHIKRILTGRVCVNAGEKTYNVNKTAIPQIREKHGSSNSKYAHSQSHGCTGTRTYKHRSLFASIDTI